MVNLDNVLSSVNWIKHPSSFPDPPSTRSMDPPINIITACSHITSTYQLVHVRIQCVSYLELFHESERVHFYTMISLYDIRGLCKRITSFNIIQCTLGKDTIFKPETPIIAALGLLLLLLSVCDWLLVHNEMKQLKRVSNF